MRQLLDLEPLWRDMPHLFITEDTALGRSVMDAHPSIFVEHVALGQARLGSPVKMLLAGARNFLASFRAVWRHRPDIVITTGAGSMFFTVLWARIFGARIVVIDSFARFDRPSLFARFTAPLAHRCIAQAEGCGRNWPGSVVYDPFRTLDTPRPAKKKLLFATVGATLRFDRLVHLVAHAKAEGLLDGYDIVVQSGKGGICPDGVECHETLPYDRMIEILRDADIVVCHGGTGSLITALREGCRVIAVPRLFDRGEHYDDHQSEITQAFAERGLLEIAHDDAQFADALERVSAHEPVCATTDASALIAFLREDLGLRDTAGA